MESSEQQLKDVEKLARLAGNALSPELKHHIKNNHIFPAKQGKSYFMCTEETFVWNLLHEACNYPDFLTSHSSDVNRYVLKKKFTTPVGVHGKTGGLCFFVTVIYNSKERRIVTAFPTV